MITGILIALAVVVPLGLIGLGVWRYRRIDRHEVIEKPFAGRLIDPGVAQFISDHAWGKSVRRRYVPEQYDGPISCLTCGKGLIPGQHFWETPLIDRATQRPTGRNFQTCFSCQPGDAAKVIDV